MSTTAQDALARLPAAVRALVIAASPDPASAPDLAPWLDKAAQPDVASPASIQALDAHLSSRTFLVGHSLTAADVAIYGALHPTISQETSAQHYAHPALTRYFDHVQTRAPVRAAQGVPPLVVFDLDGAPRAQRAGEPPKKEKKEKAGAAKPAEDGAAAKKERQPKEKKEPQPKRAPPAPAEPAAPVPSMIDLRVGHIVDVKKHPDADGLYVEQIDIGEESGPRTVVSGLVNYIPIEQMRDRRLIAVCNLKPASMRGVKSFAMVLCATSKDGKEGGIEIIDPPADAKPGDRVYFEGAYEHDQPLEQLNPKKKIFEAIQPGFITLDSREAAWVDPVSKSVHRIRTKTGVCSAPSLVGASLS